METVNSKEWAGQVVLFYTADSGPATRAAIILEDPHFETCWGERYLLGVVPPHENDWASGLQGAVRCEDVVNFMVFDSVAKYQSYVLESRLLGHPEG